MPKYNNGVKLIKSRICQRYWITTSIHCLDSKSNITRKNIYDLSTIDKQEIKKLAEITHGDYSSLIRAFLNAYYDIRVDPKIEVRTAHTNEGDEAVSEPFTISPNPTSDFIKINLFDSKKTEIRIEVLSMDGKASSIKILQPMNIWISKISAPDFTFLKLNQLTRSITNAQKF